MFILFTAEENLMNEKEQLIYFFNNGLSLLHVRKPGISENELKVWLSFFEEKYLQKMVLHQHHQCAEVFPVKGIHLKESFRLENRETVVYVEKFRRKNLSVSSAFHELGKLKKEAILFDYAFLSPVFTSVSKKNYQGRNFNVNGRREKLIALGGVRPENIQKIKAMGYKGMAVLGAVWLAEDPVQSFEEIYKTYQNVYT